MNWLKPEPIYLPSAALDNDEKQQIYSKIEMLVFNHFSRGWKPMAQYNEIFFMIILLNDYTFAKKFKVIENLNEVVASGKSGVYFNI